MVILKFSIILNLSISNFASQSSRDTSAHIFQYSYAFASNTSFYLTKMVKSNGRIIHATIRCDASLTCPLPRKIDRVWALDSSIVFLSKIRGHAGETAVTDLVGACDTCTGHGILGVRTWGSQMEMLARKGFERIIHLGR